MLNDDQKRYTISRIEEYEKEANRADRRAFWDLIGVFGSAALIGVSSLLAKDISPAHADAISCGIKAIGFVSGTTFFSQVFANHSESNVKQGNADLLHDTLDIDEREYPSAPGRHSRR